MFSARRPGDGIEEAAGPGEALRQILRTGEFKGLRVELRPVAEIEARPKLRVRVVAVLKTASKRAAAL